MEKFNNAGIRFFFNAKTGNCEQFQYGGCGGNDNRFGSIEECQNRLENHWIIASIGSLDPLDHWIHWIKGLLDYKILGLKDHQIKSLLDYKNIDHKIIGSWDHLIK